MPGCCSPHLYGKKSHDDDIGITQTPGGNNPPPRCHTAVIFLRLSGRSNTSMGKTPVSRIRPKKMWLASWTPESSEISSSRPFWCVDLTSDLPSTRTCQVASSSKRPTRIVMAPGFESDILCLYFNVSILSQSKTQQAWRVDTCPPMKRETTTNWSRKWTDLK